MELARFPPRVTGGGGISGQGYKNVTFQSPVLIDHLLRSRASCPWRDAGLFLLTNTNRFPVALRPEGASSPPWILLLPLALGQF